MNKYDPAIHHRRSIRLKGYDYKNSGLYFVTIDIYRRQPLFGILQNGEMILNLAGEMVRDVWLSMPTRFENTVCHAFIIMPEHFHAILEICPPLQDAESNKSLGEMIGAFKSITTNAYIHGVREKGWPPFDAKLWHRNYFEHIIRDDRAYENITAYIENNPRRR